MLTTALGLLVLTLVQTTIRPVWWWLWAIVALTFVTAVILRVTDKSTTRH